MLKKIHNDCDKKSVKTQCITVGYISWSVVTDHSGVPQPQLPTLGMWFTWLRDFTRPFYRRKANWWSDLWAMLCWEIMGSAIPVDISRMCATHLNIVAEPIHLFMEIFWRQLPFPTTSGTLSHFKNSLKNCFRHTTKSIRCWFCLQILQLIIQLSICLMCCKNKSMEALSYCSLVCHSPWVGENQLRLELFQSRPSVAASYWMQGWLERNLSSKLACQESAWNLS